MEKKSKQMPSGQEKKGRKEHPGKKNTDKNSRPEASAKENKKNHQWEKGKEEPGHKDADADMDDNYEDRM